MKKISLLVLSFLLVNILATDAYLINTSNRGFNYIINNKKSTTSGLPKTYYLGNARNIKSFRLEYGDAISKIPITPLIQLAKLYPGKDINIIIDQGVNGWHITYKPSTTGSLYIVNKSRTNVEYIINDQAPRILTKDVGQALTLVGDLNSIKSIRLKQGNMLARIPLNIIYDLTKQYPKADIKMIIKSDFKGLNFSFKPIQESYFKTIEQYYPETIEQEIDIGDQTFPGDTTGHYEYESFPALED